MREQNGQGDAYRGLLLDTCMYGHEQQRRSAGIEEVGVVRDQGVRGTSVQMAATEAVVASGTPGRGSVAICTRPSAAPRLIEFAVRRKRQRGEQNDFR